MNNIHYMSVRKQTHYILSQLSQESYCPFCLVNCFLETRRFNKVKRARALTHDPFRYMLYLLKQYSI